MPRTNLSADESRQLILDEAERLFRTLGYAKTTIGDIAEACGFSPSNVHKHFGTKAAVNEACAERMLRMKDETARIAARKEASAADKLRAYLTSLNETTKRLLISEKRVHEMVLYAIDERWEVVAQFRERMQRDIEDIIRGGMESGEFTGNNASKTARQVFSASAKLLHPIMVAESEEFSAEGVAEELIEFLIEALTSSKRTTH
ncbi:MAG: TetR family transcriptional regulator [Pseudomonadota bacterium]